MRKQNSTSLEKVDFLNVDVLCTLKMLSKLCWVTAGWLKNCQIMSYFNQFIARGFHQFVAICFIQLLGIYLPTVLVKSGSMGRIQDFHLGGAQKCLCQHAHDERRTELTFTHSLTYFRVHGPLKGPGSSGVVLMVSRAI